MKNTAAVILAGGLGTRLSGLFPGKPKSMAVVGGRPFIEYLLDVVASAGFSRVLICTGHLASQVENHLGARYGELEIVYSREAAPLGTAGALSLALPLIEAETALVLNGDTCCGADIGKFFCFHRGKNADASMVLAERESSRASGVVETDAEDRILRFSEKKNEKGRCLVSAGVYLINRPLIGEIPGGISVSLEKKIFPSWTGRGFFGFSCQCDFIDIGTPEGFREAEGFLKTSKA